MADATLVTVLRHGEVAGRPHVLRGASDEPSTPDGIRQVLAVAAALPAPAAVASSPLSRCHEPALRLAERHGLPVTVLPDMTEMAFGAWEGLTADAARAMAPDDYAALLAGDDAARAPGGESLAAFRRRVRRGWDAWLAEAAGGHRLLVTHAGVMRVLLCDCLAMRHDAFYRIALPEAAHFQVSWLPGHPPILLSLNACMVSCSHSSS